MRAIIADSLGSIDSYQLHEIADPSPKAGELLVQVVACGVGYVDTLVALGRYQVKPSLPHIPGQEIAGIVQAVGEGVAGWKVGDRVMAMAPKGFAQLVVVPAIMALPISANIAFEQAASLPLNYLTAWHGLRDRANLQSGETLVVIGGAGGVGSAAVQIGKALGAKVVAVASTPEKREFAMQLGADAVLDTQADGWRDRLKSILGGKGPDVIFDPVCGPLFELAFRSLAWRGRHLVVGFVGGMPALPANLTLMKGAALMGVDVRQFLQFDGKQLKTAFGELLGWAAEGQIVPAVGQIYPMSDFKQAMQQAISGQVCGKVVLTLND